MNPASTDGFTEPGGTPLPKEWLHEFLSLIELEWLLEGDDADVVPGAGPAEAAVVLVLPQLGGVAELLGAVVVQNVVLARDHADSVRPERETRKRGFLGEIFAYSTNLGPNSIEKNPAENPADSTRKRVLSSCQSPFWSIESGWLRHYWKGPSFLVHVYCGQDFRQGFRQDFRQDFSAGFFCLLNWAPGYTIDFKFVRKPRFAASCCGDDVILVVDYAAAEEGPRGVLERHQVRKLNRKELPCFIDSLYTWGM